MANPIVVCDFGGTNTKVSRGTLIEPPERSFESASVAELLGFLRETIVPAETVVAVLIFPAPMLQSPSGRILSPLSTKFKFLAGSIPSLESEWSRTYNCRVVIRQDGEMALYGAIATGDVTPDENVFVTMLGTSASGGFVLRGQPLIGDYTSQFSHVVLDPKGPQCPEKGHAGCVKTFLAAYALKNRSEKMGLPRELDEVTRLARQGNEGARSFYCSVAETLAKALSQVANLVPLKAIVLGGGIASGAGDLLLQPLREAFTRGDFVDANVAAGIALRLTKSANPVVDGGRYLAEQILLNHTTR